MLFRSRHVEVCARQAGEVRLVALGQPEGGRPLMGLSDHFMPDPWRWSRVCHRHVPARCMRRNVHVVSKVQFETFPRVERPGRVVFRGVGGWSAFVLVLFDHVWSLHCRQQQSGLPVALPRGRVRLHTRPSKPAAIEGNPGFWARPGPEMTLRDAPRCHAVLQGVTQAVPSVTLDLCH